MNNITLSSQYVRETQIELERRTEPLLQPETRKTIYPILHDNLWNFYNIHRSLHWDETDIDLTKDERSWNTLSEGEQFFLKSVLSFFANSDFIVNESVAKDSSEISIHEYDFFMTNKKDRENIHSLTYANLLQFFVKNIDERKELENAVITIPTVKLKAEWFRKYIQEGSFAERTIATIIVEGIFFSGSFASIFFFKKQGKLPSLCSANVLISRDENIHMLFAIEVYNMLVNKLPKYYVIQMIKEAVDVEAEYIKAILPNQLPGMNAESMKQYIEFVADFVSIKIIGEKIYGSSNPFEFMNMINVGTIETDFFSHRSMEYSKQSIMVSKEQNMIRFDADF
jgi:ribonucleoside-diphosphate reductase beta chain